MQLLIHEMGLRDTVDPLGGSYFIETMTNEMEKQMVSLMERLDSEGGVLKGIAEGRVQADVNRQAYEMERKIQSGEFEKVGVNCFVEQEEKVDIAFHPYREQEANAQRDRLARIRSERDDARVAKELAKVREAAESDANVMPAIMDAVEAYATVGEICQTLKDVFGTYREPVRF